jgi:cellulose synthase/poly-beta-1,6-N-acetylglucosamine synthase-like glycosyltransferase
MEQLHPFLNIFFAFCIGYFFFILYMMRHKSVPKQIPAQWPKVSILVPFRNEQENIAGCCNALINLDYPVANLDIILLNDNSNDESVGIAREKIKNYPHISIQGITEEKSGLKAKMNVIAQGITLSKGDFIFITDADCQPASGWVKHSLAHFNQQTALVSGFTILDQKPLSLFGLLQKLDWIYLQGLAYYSSIINKPFTVIGNNLAFKKSIYNQLGGFEKIGFSITEDHALMKAIIDRTAFKVKYVRDEEALVYSNPLYSFSDFLRQRLRWIKGGFSGRLFAYALVGFTFFLHMAIIFVLFSGLWNPVTATCIGLVIGVEYFFMKNNLSALNLSIYKKYFPLFEMYYYLYPIILLLFLPFIKNLKWKGRQY